MISTVIYSSKNGEDKIELMHNVVDDNVGLYCGGSSSPSVFIEFHREELIEFAKEVIKFCE